MAAVQAKVGEFRPADSVYVVDLTTIQPGAAIDVAHSGPSGAEVFKVDHEVVVRPTSNDPVVIRHIRASDVAASNTARVVVDTIPGGDLAGATVRLYLYFIAQGSGGIG